MIANWHADNDGRELSQLLWEPVTEKEIVSEVDDSKARKSFNRSNLVVSPPRTTDLFEPVHLLMPLVPCGSTKYKVDHPYFSENRARRRACARSTRRDLRFCELPLDVDITRSEINLKLRAKGVVRVFLPDFDAGQRDYVRWEVNCKRREYVIERIDRVIDEISAALSAEKDTRIVYIKLREGKYYLEGNGSNSKMMIDVNGCLSDTKAGKRKFESIVEALKICRRALEDNVTITKRGLFYKGVTTFKTQSQSDSTIDLIAMNFAIFRCCLNIMALPKGAVYGNMSFITKSREVIDCLVPNDEWADIPDFENIASYSYTAKFVLVVEKATIFAELVSSKFVGKYGPCIIICGGGYPDTRTRCLVSHISQMERLPVYALTDLDPYGMDIYLCYKYGSRVMAYNNALLTCPTLKWIDTSYTLYQPTYIGEAQSGLIPINGANTTKVVSMLKTRSEILKLEPSLRRSLQLLIIQGYTHEIELYTLDKLVTSVIAAQVWPSKLAAVHYHCVLTTSLPH